MNRVHVVAAILVTSIAVVQALTPREVYGCSCARSTTAEMFAGSDAVFRGRVVEEHKYNYQLGVFELYEVWKGPRTPILSVGTSIHVTACGALFSTGQEGIVFAGWVPYTRQYHTSICSYRRVTEQLEQELSSLAEGHLLGNICPHIAPHIPESIRQDALEHPNHYFGWALLTDPNKPESPFNTRRTWLSLRNPSTPYSPSNDLLWKTGCP